MHLFLQSSHISVFWPGIILLGFSIGFLSGFFGVGGGFLLTPLLRFIFGIPFEIAIGSSLGAIALSSIAGAFSHYRLGNISFRLGLFLLCGSIPGVEIGTRLLTLFKSGSLQMGNAHLSHVFDTTLGCFYLVLLLISTWLMLKDALRYSKEQQQKPVIRDISTYKLRMFFNQKKLSILDLETNTDHVNGYAVIAFGLFVGILSGFLGVGGGMIVTPVLISVAGLPAVIAIGTSLFQLMITAAIGAVSHTLRGHMDVLLIGLVVFVSIAGSMIGSKLTSKFRGKKIRLLYAGFLFLSAAFILIEILLQYS